LFVGAGVDEAAVALAEALLDAPVVDEEAAALLLAEEVIVDMLLAVLAVEAVEAVEEALADTVEVKVESMTIGGV